MCGHAWAIGVVATRGRGVVATRGSNVRPGARARPMATCGLCLQRSLARAANSHAWATGGLQISAAWAMRGHKGRRTSGPAQRAFFKLGVSVPHTLCSAAWLGQGRVGVRWRTRATRGREGCAGLLSADKSHAWQKGLRRTTIGHVWPNYPDLLLLRPLRLVRVKVRVRVRVPQDYYQPRVAWLSGPSPSSPSPSSPSSPAPSSPGWLGLRLGGGQGPRVARNI